MKEDAWMKVAHLLCEYAEKERQHIFLPVKSWRPGLIVTVSAPVVTEDDLAASDMLLLESAEHDIWICAKMSPEIKPLGAWDYMLDGERWNAFSARVELDKTLEIHVNDLGNQAYAAIPDNILAEILEIFYAYESGEPAPPLPQDYVGGTEEERKVYLYALEEFKNFEEGFMSRLRLHLHEGWMPEEGREPLEDAGQGRDVVIPFAQDKPLFSFSKNIYEYAPAASSDKIEIGGEFSPVHAEMRLKSGRCIVTNKGREAMGLVFYAVGERGRSIALRRDGSDGSTILAAGERKELRLSLPDDGYKEIVMELFRVGAERS